MSNSVADMQLFFMGLHEKDHTFSCKNTDQLSSLWAAFTKCKQNIRDGFRLENMSWRLWYREAMMRKRLDAETSLVLPQQDTLTSQQYTNNNDTTTTKLPRLVRTRSLPSISCQAQHMMESCQTSTSSIQTDDDNDDDNDDDSNNDTLMPKRSKFYIEQDEEDTITDDEDSFDENEYDDYDDYDDDTRFSSYSGYASFSSSSSFSEPSLDEKDHLVGPLQKETKEDHPTLGGGLRRSHCYSRLDQWFSAAALSA